MIKHKLFVTDISREEAWINQIIAKGYRLKRVTPSLCRYEFEALDSFDASEKNFLPQVRIDFRTFSKQNDFTDYLALFEDCGWHHVYGTKSNGSQYFEKMTPDCQDEIFSDHASKAERYRRISNLWLGLFAVYLPLLIVYFSAGILRFPQFDHWKDWYYTPGLWEMTGGRFLGAFLFETPFALGRGMGGIFPLLFLVIVLGYAFFGLKARYWYRKENSR